MRKPDPAHLGRLERLQRMREIARLQAMQEAADALGELSRAQALARRSAELAKLGHAEAATGEDLRAQLSFGAALRDVSEIARRSAQSAHSAADHAQTQLNQRSRERDLVAEKVDDAQRLTMRHRAEQGSASPVLARSLNSTPVKRPKPGRQQRNDV